MQLQFSAKRFVLERRGAMRFLESLQEVRVAEATVPGSRLTDEVACGRLGLILGCVCGLADTWSVISSWRE